MQRNAREAARMMRLGTLLVDYVVDMLEMASAVPAVMAQRVTRFQGGLCEPGSADHAENLRMVSEKAEAAALTGPALFAGTVAWQRASLHFWQEAMLDGWQTSQKLAACRSPLAVPAVLTGAWESAAGRARNAGLRAARDQITLVSEVLEPYHSRVTANARRLGKPRPPARR